MKRAIRHRPEQVLHRQVAAYLDAARQADWMWWHIPNGGFRTDREAAIFKAMGVKPGMPDIEILWRGRSHFIELKAAKGAVTAIQEARHQDVMAAGGRVAICRTLGEVIAAMDAWGIPRRAKLAA